MDKNNAKASCPKVGPVPQRPPRVADPSNLTDTSTDENEFEQHYKEAYKLIDHGIILVTEGKNVEANKAFEDGLNLLDKALAIKVETFDIGAEQIQIYSEMQLKMRCTRKEVLLHFSNAQTSTNGPNINDNRVPALEDAPPSYDEYISSLNDDVLPKQVSYPTLNSIDFQAQSPIVSPILSPQDGEMIFHIENGVQIFFIYANGRVTSPSYPSFLSIFTFKELICSNGASGSLGARGFLQVGEWSYPLVVAQSPVLHSFYGAYIFIDPANPEPGTSVGILIPDTVDRDTKELFEQILAQMTSYQEQETPLGINAQEEKLKIQKSAAEQVAEGLVTGAEVVSQGVIWGAEKLASLIAFGSDKLKDSLTPEAQHRVVDPKWQKTASVARNVSGKAVKVSGFLLSQVGKATLALGRRVAPSLHKHSTIALGRFTGQGEKETHAQVDGVMEVATGAVKGASTIYMSLETAAANLAYSLSQNTVKVVTHKYGTDYGELTDNTLNAVGQAAMATHNITSLGVKGIAKRTAKDTGKALVEDYEKKKKYDKVLEDEVMDGVEEGKEATENSRGSDKRPIL